MVYSNIEEMREVVFSDMDLGLRTGNVGWLLLEYQEEKNQKFLLGRFISKSR